LSFTPTLFATIKRVEMSVLLKNKISRLSRLLKSESSVEFKHNDFYYEVFESADSGYIINLYSSDERDEDEQYIEANLVDGGLCSGNERDAIEFML
jgi:hypothetical protein